MQQHESLRRRRRQQPLHAHHRRRVTELGPAHELRARPASSRNNCAFKTFWIQVGHGLTAAIPMENPCCSCKLPPDFLDLQAGPDDEHGQATVWRASLLRAGYKEIEQPKLACVGILTGR